MVDGSGIGVLVRDLDGQPPFRIDETLAERLHEQLGALRTRLLVADYSERLLTAVDGDHDGPHGASAHLVEYPVDDSMPGVAFREQRIVEVTEPSGDVRMLLPVRVRSERIGVLDVVLPTVSAENRAYLDEVAVVLGHVISAARRYTDRFEVLRRRHDMDIAAEIQWELLPVLAYDCAEFSIAGSLEPAYRIGGDTFDYAVADGSLTLSVTDAMGHGVRAALMASLAVTTIRNARRRGDSLAEQARFAARHVADQFGDPGYVAGIFVRIDVPTGMAGVVDAGHLAPLLLRDGEVTDLPLRPDTPLGMFAETDFVEQPMQLHPGDRLLLYTDGISDVAVDDIEPFGRTAVARLLADHAGQIPSEFVRLLTNAALDHGHGELADDATAVCLDLHGGK
jgi:serine phosphatase RsbU (regulator of sigma subunit)